MTEKAATFLLPFVLAVFAYAQEFAVEIRKDAGNAKDVGAISRSLAAPLVQNGADPRLNNEQSPGIRAAAERLAHGYSYSGKLVYALGGAVARLQYPIHNLSTGKSDTCTVFIAKDAQVTWDAGRCQVQRNLESTAYWSPFDRFAYLGLVEGAQDVDRSQTGRFEAVEAGTVKWTVEWKPEGKGRIRITGTVHPLTRGPVRMADAVVAGDRSNGLINRYMPNGSRIETIRFVRQAASVPPCNNVELPKGTRVSDYRGDPDEPARYLWNGALPPVESLKKGAGENGRAPSPGATAARIGLPILGVGLILLGWRPWARRKAPGA